MLENILEYIQAIIVQYGATGVFIATLLEELIAPIPSPIVALAAGFSLINPNAAWAEAFLVAITDIGLPVAMGITIGSVAVYCIGFFGGKSMIEKYGRVLGVTWSDVERAEQKLVGGTWDEVILFILRLLPLLPGVAISALCGIIRYPIASFAGITFAGAFIRAFLLAMVGWQVGELYTSYADTFALAEKYGSYALIIVAFFFLILYVSKKMKRGRPKT